MNGAVSAFDLVTMGDGFVYLENRGNGRDEACWCGYVTPEGVTIRFGKIGRSLSTRSVPVAACKGGSAREELVAQVSGKLDSGFAPGESNATSKKLMNEFDEANRKDVLQTAAEAAIPAGQPPVYWTIRAEKLTDSMRGMALDFMLRFQGNPKQVEILRKPAIDARGDGYGAMESAETLVLAALADKLPSQVIGMADDNGASISVETLREQAWVTDRFEDLAADLGILKRPIKWGKTQHPASAGGWF